MESTLLVGDLLLVSMAVHGARVSFVHARMPAALEHHLLERRDRPFCSPSDDAAVKA